MIGAHTLELVLGSRAPGDKSNLKAYVRELARAGLHIVLVEPNAKAPLDMRSPAAKRADDEAAQEAAKLAGNPLWAKVRAQAGVHLATTDTTRLDRYIAAAEKRYGPDTVNLGVEVGRSRIMIVDADTGAEVERFMRDWSAVEGESAAVMPRPTVLSPGKFDRKVPVPFDPWVHRDGGHYWFTIPEGVELPGGGTGAYKAPGENGYTAYWGDRQILIPPSVRPEGAYRWHGGIRDVPPWLLAEIEAQTAHRKDKARERIDSIDSPVDTWAATTPWADVLEPDGWVNSGRVSNCGCPEWTAPGPHDSHKSATAHDLGCTDPRYDGSQGHAPLHVWTDNPPEGIAAYVRKHNTKTLSKLQYVAWTHHAGDLDAACQALEIPYSTPVDDAFGAGPGEPLFSEADWSERDRIMAERQGDAYDHSTDAAEAAVPPFGEVPESAEVGEYDPELDWWAKHAGPVDKFRHIPPVEPLIEGFLDFDSLSNIIGPPGAGKSFLALDMVASIATGVAWQGRPTRQAKVLYVVGEGLSGFNARIHAWEKDRGLDLGQVMHLVDEPVQVSDAKRWHMLAMYCLHHGIEVLVLDTLNRITVGVEENSAKDMSRVVDALDKVRTFAGCHVCVVHHTTRGTDHGRGSTALEGAVDTVLLVNPANAGQGFSIETMKQKNHAPADEVTYNLKAVDTSAVVVDPSTGAAITDPLDPFNMPVPVPEVTEVERMAAIVDVIKVTAFETGLTRSQIVKHVYDDRISINRMTPNTKEQFVFHAIDSALRAGHIEGVATAAGNPSTTKFVVGPVPLAD
jgi:hypothetical protein